MMHGKRGFMAMLFGTSLSFVAGCDEGDSLDSLSDREDVAEDDINDGESDGGGPTG